MKSIKPFVVCGTERRSDRSFPVCNPFDGSILYEMSSAGPADVEAAISGAAKARQIMNRLPLYQRSRIIRSASDFIQKNSDDVIASIVLEAGKPLRFARAETERCIENLQLCAECMTFMNGETINMDASAAGVFRRGYWFREAVGVVLAISPFNFPLNLVAHKLAPAVAAACPVILKPASKTPGGALWLTRAFLEAGLPAEAISCLCGSGDDVASPLVQHPDVAKVTFTGSYSTGMEIARLSGMKKITLELGSNSAAIVDDELTDFEYAVKRLCLGAFYYQGQVCISVQRIFVRDSIFHDFVERFIEKTSQLKLGDPREADTDIGPMISPAEALRVKSIIDSARENGGNILFGSDRNGSFISPTVLTSVKPDDPAAADEIFGPVVVIEPFKTIEEAIDRVNESRFGLQAGIFTRRIDTAEKAIRDLQVGGVVVNDFPSYRLDHMPYGGVKNSGVGREGARFAIEEMTRIKMVVINHEVL